MTDFKVGDRVIYKAAAKTTTPKLEGVCGTVTRFVDIDEVHVDWDGDVSRMKVLSQNLQHLVSPVPDVITINRADLPEVSAEYEASDFPGKDAPRVALAVLLAAGWNSADETVQSLRSVIVGYEKSIAYDIAVNGRAKRRDELAAELAPRAYASLGANWYGNVGEPLQKAIDRIIDLEAETK